MIQNLRKIILETDRLFLREMNDSDIPALSSILQDAETMTAYEHAFSDNEVQKWFEKIIHSYQKNGFGLWAVVLKEAPDQMIGQCGLTLQPLTLQSWDDQMVLEIGYLFQKSHWHQGYALEAAQACKHYAFEKLQRDEVYSIIRDTNLASLNVAIRNGMVVRGRFIKHYHGIDMPHLVFSAKRCEPDNV